MLWEYPIGGGYAAFDINGLKMTSPDYGFSYAGLRHVNNQNYFGQKATYEVEVMVISVSGHGVRIVLPSGRPGVNDNRGLQVTINGNYLNVLKKDQSPIDLITMDAPVSYNQWHKIRLKINISANNNAVYLDDNLITTVTNDDLSTFHVTSCWSLFQSDPPYEGYIRSIRYRNED